VSATLRVAAPSDAREIQAIYAPTVRDTAISFESEPPSEDEICERVAATLVTHPWLVACERKRLLGYAYATRHRARHAYRWSAEVSAYVHADARGRGVGAGLYTSLLALLVQQGYLRAYAGITLPNPASVALHESAGFTPVGVYRQVGFKLGAWHDVGWWERSLGGVPEAPAEPIPFAELSNDPEVSRALAIGAERVRA
jgi:phosphinothricin acetyltransferase